MKIKLPIITAALLLLSSPLLRAAQEPEQKNPLKWSNGKTSATLGGFVHVVTSFDFNGAVDNEDFIPSYTPVQDKWANDQRFSITPSYSQLNFTLLHQSDKIGEIKAYFEVDFRGVGNAIRLRHAYVTAKGLLVGQTNSLAVDIASTGMTIDVQGINTRSLLRTPMIAYSHRFGKGFSAAASLEAPLNMIFTNQLLNISNLTPEVSELTTAVGNASQTVPDILAYIQNDGDLGHIKVLGIYRRLTYHDLVRGCTASDNGYGFQLGGALNLSPRFTLYTQGTYGVGIARYINDLARILTDMIPNTNNKGELSPLPMWGASAGIKAVLSDKVYLTSNFSRVKLDRISNYDLDVLYHSGDYLSSTIFYSPLKNATLALEYLYGSHKTMNGSFGEANRLQMMIKYAF